MQPISIGCDDGTVLVWVERGGDINLAAFESTGPGTSLRLTPEGTRSLISALVIAVRSADGLPLEQPPSAS